MQGQKPAFMRVVPQVFNPMPEENSHRCSNGQIVSEGVGSMKDSPAVLKAGKRSFTERQGSSPQPDNKKRV